MRECRKQGKERVDAVQVRGTIWGDEELGHCDGRRDGVAARPLDPCEDVEYGRAIAGRPFELIAKNAAAERDVPVSPKERGEGAGCHRQLSRSDFRWPRRYRPFPILAVAATYRFGLRSRMTRSPRTTTLMVAPGFSP